MSWLTIKFARQQFHRSIRAGGLAERGDWLGANADRCYELFGVAERRPGGAMEQWRVGRRICTTERAPTAPALPPSESVL